MGIRVRLFNNTQKLNEADAQTTAAKIAQYQQMIIDINKKTSLQIQNLQKQCQQKIDAYKKEIIKLQSELTASTGAVNNSADVNDNTQQNNQNTNTGVSANQ